MLDKRTVKGLHFIALGVIIWMLYLFTREMNRYCISYSIFTISGWDLNEILTVLYALILITTFIWILVLIINIIRTKKLVSHRILFCSLMVFFVIQCVDLYNQLQLEENWIATSVKRVDTYRNLIIIDTDEHKLTLETPELIQEGIIKSDGTEYFIYYEYNKADPKHGRLCGIKVISGS